MRYIWLIFGVLLVSTVVFAEGVEFNPASGNRLLGSGVETTGLARGPLFQLLDANGNLLVSRFVLNTNFTNVQVFEANTTNTVAGPEIVVGGVESSGLKRGPAFQVFDSTGNLLITRFVLNPDFTEITFRAIDVDNDGLDEILVTGRETSGLQRGPAFQLFSGAGTLLLTRFALNVNFTDLKVFAIDQDGNGDKEIGIGGVESSGLRRGPAYQVFNADGNLLLTKFVLNSDFAGFPTVLGTYAGTASTTQSGCLLSANNGVSGAVSYLSISNQTESAFSGVAAHIGNGFTDVISLTGSLTGTGQVSGSFSFTLFVDGSAVASGGGTFTGQASGNVLTANYTGQFTSGEACHVSGSSSGTR